MATPSHARRVMHAHERRGRSQVSGSMPEFGGAKSSSAHWAKNAGAASATAVGRCAVAAASVTPAGASHTCTGTPALQSSTALHAGAAYRPHSTG